MEECLIRGLFDVVLPENTIEAFITKDTKIPTKCPLERLVPERAWGSYLSSVIKFPVMARVSPTRNIFGAVVISASTPLPREVT